MKIESCSKCNKKIREAYWDIFDDLCCFDCMLIQNQKFLTEVRNGRWMQRQKGWRFSSPDYKRGIR